MANDEQEKRLHPSVAIHNLAEELGRLLLRADVASEQGAFERGLSELRRGVQEACSKHASPFVRVRAGGKVGQ